MRFEWQGYYLDGESANRWNATIRLSANGIEVQSENGEIHRLSYSNLRQTQGFYSGEQVRLEWGTPLPKAVILLDTVFLTDLHRVAGSRAKHLHNPSRRTSRLKVTALAGLGAVGLALFFYFWAIPSVVSAVIPHIPISWEEQLGSSIIENLEMFGRRCRPSDGSEAIEQIFLTLTEPLDKMPYSFQIIILDSPIVNALAAPGGYIVLFRGLVEETRSPEELAGVLAHEAQHILKRHSTKALLRQASTRILIAAIAGDASAATRFGLDSARTLGLLEHTRRAESEADQEGIRMMIAAGIDPNGMIAFFESIKKDGGDVPEFMTYLSTHPGTSDRIEKLTQTIAEIPEGEIYELLPDQDWDNLKKVCS